MSDDFHTHPKPGTFTHYPTDFERLEVAEAHIKRLTAELAERDTTMDTLSAMLAAVEAAYLAAEAREKALRAITAEMLDLHGDGLVSWVRVCNEWDRRAASVT